MREASIGLLDNLVRNVMLGPPDGQLSQNTPARSATFLSEYEDGDTQPPAETDIDDGDVPLDGIDLPQASGNRRPGTWLDALVTDLSERSSAPENSISAVNSDDVGLYRLLLNHSP
ncbi:hypothetical protein FE840_005175 [Peteryoungia desertarenae]|uniref:Uncharacterized protein n=1 Tax=Peteryoungia desertarenae TaxID=1813451 RepID=A0ABX6QK86_9HYPH|nr:hypothetical protein [Peteryoungia desertarenae]QLF68981.1 hypothetical protein FE840_005175 [Peteryoungia desertarenae]